jgi:hypothetical protein
VVIRQPIGRNVWLLDYPQEEMCDY